MNFAEANQPQALPEQVDMAIVRLLAHRYGDGLVYLPDQEERRLYERAVNMGLISREGYLTPTGRCVVARFRAG